jgi:hypothetical protein
MDEQPSLGELIRAVRQELEYARTADADNPLRFDVGPVELDVEVEVSKTWHGDGGFDVKVLKADLSRDSVHGATSRVHVVLTPYDLRTQDGRYTVRARDTEPPPAPPAPSDPVPSDPVPSNTPPTGG